MLEDAILTSTPALLTAATDAPAPAGHEGGDTPAVHRHQPELTGSDLLVQAAESAVGSGAVSLATARVVIGGGRGVGGPEGFAPLEELAGLLGGRPRRVAGGDQPGLAAAPPAGRPDRHQDRP